MYINQVFKLTMVLDADKFDRIFRKRDLLEVDKNEYIDVSMAHKGITVLYRDSRYKKKVSLVVDSTVALKGKGLDAHKLIHKLEKRIGEYFGGRYSLEDFTLTELTLTADINIGNQDTVASYIRVIRRVGKVKGFSPVRYEGLDEGKSFCLEGNSNGISFLLYDLHAALANRSGGGCVRQAILRDTKGILRAEVRLTSSKAIRNHSNRDVYVGKPSQDGMAYLFAKDKNAPFFIQLQEFHFLSLRKDAERNYYHGLLLSYNVAWGWKNISFSIILKENQEAVWQMFDSVRSAMQPVGQTNSAGSGMGDGSYSYPWQ